MIILGIDPGLATTGYGVIEVKDRQSTHIAHGVIVTKAGEIHIRRLQKIHREMKKLLKRYNPDAVSVEKLFVNKNVKTALIVGEARGVVLLSLAVDNRKVYEFTPLQIKQGLTSYGRASKQQMQKMIRTILRLNSVPRPDDAADGLAVALLAAQTSFT
jgi:crossover junction endodeoxyribonuclease RuvC